MPQFPQQRAISYSREEAPTRQSPVQVTPQPVTLLELPAQESTEMFHMTRKSKEADRQTYTAYFCIQPELCNSQAPTKDSQRCVCLI